MPSSFNAASSADANASGSSDTITKESVLLPWPLPPSTRSPAGAPVLPQAADHRHQTAEHTPSCQTQTLKPDNGAYPPSCPSGGVAVLAAALLSLRPDDPTSDDGAPLPAAATGSDALPLLTGLVDDAAALEAALALGAAAPLSFRANRVSLDSRYESCGSNTSDNTTAFPRLSKQRSACERHDSEMPQRAPHPNDRHPVEVIPPESLFIHCPRHELEAGLSSARRCAKHHQARQRDTPPTTTRSSQRCHPDLVQRRVKLEQLLSNQQLCLTRQRRHTSQHGGPNVAHNAPRTSPQSQTRSRRRSVGRSESCPAPTHVHTHTHTSTTTSDTRTTARGEPALPTAVTAPPR